MNLAVRSILGLHGATRRVQVAKAGLAFALACAAALASRPALGSVGTVQYAGIPSVVSTTPVSLSGPQDAQSDGNGNLYIADTFGNKIVKVTSGGAASVVPMTGLSPALSSPQRIALDAAGNLYITDADNARVVKVSSGGTVSVVSSAPVSLSYPSGIAVDGSGNLYVSDLFGNQIVKIPASGTPAVLSISGLSTPLSNPDGIALDSSGNLYIADAGNSRIVTVTPAGVGSVVSITGVAISGVRDVAVGPGGILYIADVNNNRVVTVPSSGGAGTVLTPGGVSYTTLFGVSVDTSGTVYVTDVDAAKVNRFVRNVSVASTNVGSTSSTIGLTFAFTGPFTIAAPSVMTMGISSLDFTDAGTGTCTTNGTSYSYVGGNTCTVNVNFTPTAPGVRYGAVVIKNNSGNVLATAYISGTGVAPMTAFPPGLPVTVATVSAPYNLSLVYGMATDASGNVYAADYAGNAVYKETLSAGTFTQSTIRSGLSAPQSVAVDGTGNVYISNSGGNAVLKETPSAGSYIESTVATISSPSGIAVDARGNVYVLAYQSGTAYMETPTASGYVQSVVATGLNGPRAIAVDGSGNVYIADQLNSRVVKETPSAWGYTQTIVGSGFSYPSGVAVDAIGNVYVTGFAGGAVYKETPSGAGYLQSTFSTAVVGYGAAVDQKGNVYLSTSSGIVELDTFDPPNLSYASSVIGSASSDSPKTVTLTNAGNSSLTIAAPQAGSNPSIANGFALNGATTCPLISAGGSLSTLTALTSCVYAIDFVPVAAGATSGSLVLTDDNLNQSGAMQTIGLSGTGVAPADNTSLAVTASPVRITLGQSVTITAKATDTTSAGTTPTGSVTFTDTVGGTTTSLNSGSAVAMSAGAATLSNVVLSGAGTHTITATYAGVSGSFNGSSASATVSVAPAANVGTAAAAFPVTLTVAAAGTVSTIRVLTQGVTNLDFTDAVSGDTCSGAYNIGETCTVMVAFTPTYPGTRMGAVQLADPDGNILATTYIQGLGNGPQISFSKNNKQTALGGGFAYPISVALDGSANVFLAEPTNADVKEIRASGGYGSVVTLGGGFSFGQPAGVAVDGAGNLIVADYGNSQVDQILAKGGYTTVNVLADYTKFNAPNGVAVDGSGNIYVTDQVNGAVYEMTAASGYATVTMLAGGFSNPNGVAVDGSGNVYVADNGNNAIKEVMAVGGVIPNSPTVLTLGGGFSSPNGVAVDASGAIFVADSGNGAVKTMPAGCTSEACVSRLGSGFSSPFGVALNGNGNLFLVDYLGGQAKQLNFASASGLLFPNTAVGASSSAQTVWVTNDGNVSLNLTASGVAAPADYVQVAGGGTPVDCANSLSIEPGASCNLSIAFKPLTTGLLAENFVLTDNNGNLSGATQTIGLSGIGIVPATQLAISGLPAQILAGGNLGMATVSVENSSGNAVTASSASVTVTVTGPGNYSQMVSGTAVNGVYTADLSSLALYVPGFYTVTATSTGLTSAVAQVLVQQTPVSFPGVLVGQSSKTTEVTFVFTSTQVLDDGGVGVVTGGYGGLDFTDAGTGSCASGATYNAGDSCTVDVIFKPTYPGVRNGAVMLRNVKGNVFAAVYISGVGEAGLAAFDAGVISTLPLKSVAASSKLSDLTLDPAGNFFFVDATHCNLYGFDATSSSTLLFAGTGGCGAISGDGGPISASTALYAPSRLALSGRGDLFLLDGTTIRRIDGATHVITTVAGIQQTTTYSPDGTAALGNSIGEVKSIAVDGAGNLYIGTINPSQVRKIDARTGLLSTVAGDHGAGSGFRGDGSAATSAQLNLPAALAFDAEGDLFIADQNNNIVRMVNPAGVISTVAGTAPAPYTGATLQANRGYTPDGAPATSALLNMPTAVAVDAGGDLFIADGGNLTVRKVTKVSGVISTAVGKYSGGGGAGSPNSTNTGDGGAANLAGLGFPSQVALDGSGNIFVAVSDQTTIRKVSVAKGVTAFGSLTLGSTSAPINVALENLGNQTLNFAGIYQAQNFDLGGADTSCSFFGSVPAGSSCILGNRFLPTTPGAITQTLNVNDDSNRQDASQTLTLTGTGLALPPSKLVFAPVPATVAVGGNLGTLTVSLEDTLGNVVTGATNTVTVSISGPGGFSQSVVGAAVNGVFLADLSAYALPALGSYTVTATGTSLTSATAQVQAVPPPVSFGNLPLGTPSAPMTVTIRFAAAATLGDPGVQVLTQGAPGLDFTNAKTGSCGAGLAIPAGGSCTVGVTFTPRFAGARLGAVVLTDGKGNILATQYISGTGVGPTVLFSPGTQSSVAADQSYTYGVAVDASGNVYVTSSSAGKLWKETLSGGTYTATELGSGLGDPTGVAVDGAGNVFVTDYDGGRIFEFTLSGGVYTQNELPIDLSGPEGLAVDGNGNLYIADGSAGKLLKETPDNGVYFESTIGSEISEPTGVAVDAAGNVYVSDKSNYRVLKETLANGSYTQTTVADETGEVECPYGLAVDPAGSVYVADYCSNAVLKETPEGKGGYTESEMPLDLSYPQGVAIDGAGNLYVADTYNERTIKFDRTTPPSLSFATTNAGATSSDSPQTVGIENIGNEPLTTLVPASGTNPSISSGFALDAATTCPQTLADGKAGSLAINASCEFAVDFTPIKAGLNSGSLVLTDNALGEAGGAQVIPLSGTGLALAASKLLLSTLPASLAPGGDIGTVQVQVADLYGNVISGSSASIAVTIAGPGGFSSVKSGAAVNGVFSADFSSVALSASGIYSVTATSPGLSPAAATVLVATPLSANTTSLSFGSVPQGTSSPAQTVIVANPNTFAATGISVAVSGEFSTSDSCSTIAALSSCSINVVFSPTAAGARSGTLTVTDGQLGDPLMVSLSGTGTSSGVQLSTAALDFGGVLIATPSAGQTITIQNIGADSLIVTQVATTGDFATTGDCGRIPAGTSCSLTVVFTPTATGVRAGTLTLSDHTGGASQSQAIQLTGLGTAEGVTLTPGIATFPGTTVGSSSFVFNTTLTNTGADPLTGIAISILGDFTQTNTCPSSLAAGAACTISVAYTPTVPGAETGTLTVLDNLGTQTVSLTGSGIPAGATLSTGQLLFGGQLVGASSLGQTVVFSNTGSSPIAIVSVTASSGFTRTTNCTGSIAPGGSCSVNVAFAPTAAGAASGRLTFSDDAGTQAVTLSGVGVSPGLSISPSFAIFGAQTLGTTSLERTLTITNTSSAPLTLNPPAVSNGFAVTSQCTAALAPGASCTVSLSFAPASLGIVSGALTISDTSGAYATLATVSGHGTLPGIATVPSSLFFGSVPLGTASQGQTVTVSNAGAAAVMIGAVSGVGDFSETDTCANQSLAPGESCVISVTMTPTTAGTRTGAIQFANSADGLHTIALSGVGQQSGLSVTPTNLAFGSAPIASSKQAAGGTPLSVAIANTSSSAITLGQFTTEGDFSVSSSCAATLSPGDSCNVTVTFFPTALGHRTGTLTVSDEGGGGVETVALEGDGGPAGLILTPPVLDFGVQPKGVTSAPLVATLTNNTGKAITDLSIVASGEYAETDNCGSSLADGGSCTLHITVTPATTGAITGTVAISGGGVTANVAPEENHPRPAGSGSSTAKVGVVATLADTNGLSGAAVSQLVFGIAPAPVVGFGGNAGASITVQEKNSSGTTVAATDSITLTVTGPGGYSFTYTATASGGVARFDLSTHALTIAGVYTYTVSVAGKGSIQPASVLETVLTGPTATVTLSTSDPRILFKSQATFTATISASLGSPTGTVNFLDGSTLIGSSAVSSGVAVFVTSSLAAGVHSITAAYSGDGSFAPATSGVVTQTVVDFTVGPNGVSTHTVLPGGSATYSVAITPTEGTTLPAAATLTVTGLPAGATATLSGNSWSQLTSTSWQVPASTALSDVSLTFAVPSLTARASKDDSAGRGPLLALSTILILPLAARLRRGSRRLRPTMLLLLCMVAGSAGVVGFSGCGGHNGFFGQPSKTYEITVTVTAGSLAHSTTLTLTVE